MATAVIARPAAVTSAAGVLSLLEEQETRLQVAALERLNEVVDQFWHEIADYLTEIETLHESPTFPGKELAALVASKVFYHLEEYEDALRLALGAGRMFDINDPSEYVEKIVSAAIDEYIKVRTSNFDLELKKKEPEPIDARLEDVITRFFDRCLEDKAYKQGLGMALETRRLDRVRDFIEKSDDVAGMLEYGQRSAMTLLSSKAFRERVLQVLIDIYTSSKKDVDYAALCQCYFLLNDSTAVGKTLKELLSRPDKEGQLLAYQVAFDIADNENQHFCKQLLASPFLKLKEPAAPPAAADAPAVEGATDAAAPMQVDGAPAGDTPAVDSAPPPPVAAPEAAATDDTEMTAEEKEHLTQLRKILSGRASNDLNLEFLYRNNRSDLLLLEIIKKSLDQKNSITHNGTVIAHSLMQCGTTSDVFLRKNLEWLAKATNWAKFSATASLGVIHKGHIKESKSILSTYLPAGGGARGSPYSEGGALYAMGLIHANHFDLETKTYLLGQLAQAQSNEVLCHGACLGIGLTCMATADEGIYEELKQTLYSDTAIAGEAAAYAIGLVMVGSGSEKVIGELLAYAHDTQHEKIIRACALALAMTMFRREEEAESLIQQMLLDKDPILRYGACYCIALAYVGTSQNAAIRKLLHISVSDVSDDVRRAAVMSLGFVMCNVPDQLPGVVKLLSESYNPHVRYAAAMALGIACAGSAQLDAHNLLEPLMSDGTDFVRQGAIMAMGMLYMQTSPAKTTRVKEFRDKLQKVIGDKHEGVMIRFGAILAHGIMDAGGRNSCASFFSKSGVLRPGAAIGFCLFTQMWYWFPLIHMFSLVLTPNALIGLTEKLKIPKNFQLKSGAKPSLFAYPEPLEPPKKEDQVKAATAVLSTTAKAKAGKEKEKKEKDVEMNKAEGEPMEVDAQAASAGKEAAAKAGEEQPAGEEKASGEKSDDKKNAKKDDKEEKPEEKPEPTEEILNNPCRVLKAQMQYISFPTEIEGQPARYTPLLGGKRRLGFLLLGDNRPEEAEDLFLEGDKPDEDDGENEPEPPEPFEWTDAA